MMFRTTDMVLIGVMVAAAAFTYKTKHDAENQFDQLRAVESQIRFEEDTIAILKADWSLLTQPGRLQRLTETYVADLNLADVQPTQIVPIGVVPARQLDAVGELIADGDQPLDSLDATTTGDVGQ